MLIRNDPTSLARTAPVDVAMVADLRLAAADLVAAIRGMATASRLKQIAEERSTRVRPYTKEAEFRMASREMPTARQSASRASPWNRFTLAPTRTISVLIPAGHESR
jgi:thiamine pyrophosphate-dependent acetolactate synthase large subunit-like protein